MRELTFIPQISLQTRLVISSSNQPDVAPVFVPLGSVQSIEHLYSQLTTACDLQPSEVEKVTAVSVTHVWSGKKQRLRKGQTEDFKLFNEILAKAWENDLFQHDKECEVLMLLHISG